MAVVSAIPVRNMAPSYGSFQVKLDGKEIIKRSRVNFGFGTNN